MYTQSRLDTRVLWLAAHTMVTRCAHMHAQLSSSVLLLRFSFLLHCVCVSLCFSAPISGGKSTRRHQN